jgi:hypothetical protein
MDACYFCHESQYEGEVVNRWNQSPSLREAMKFPKPGFSDNMFPDWLYKATWWAHVVAIVLGLRY